MAAGGGASPVAESAPGRHPAVQASRPGRAARGPGGEASSSAGRRGFVYTYSQCADLVPAAVVRFAGGAPGGVALGVTALGGPSGSRAQSAWPVGSAASGHGLGTTTRLSGAHGGRAHGGQAAGWYSGSGEVGVRRACSASAGPAGRSSLGPGSGTTTRLSGAHGGRAHGGQAAGRYVGSGEVGCAARAPPRQARRGVPRSGQGPVPLPG